MIVIEVLSGILIALVVLTGIVRIGAPLAEAFADRLKLKFQEIAPEQEQLLKTRISALEAEMDILRQQIASIQETTDFTVKLLQDRQVEETKKKQIS